MSGVVIVPLPTCALHTWPATLPLGAVRARPRRRRRAIPEALGRAPEPVIGEYLLDPQVRDGPADHKLLDLLGAFDDVVGPAWVSTP